MITKTYKELTKREFLIRFFDILTLVETDIDKKLTNGEIEAFVEFILLPDTIKYNRFKQEGKDIVISKFAERNVRMTSVNIHMKLVQIRKKGYIIEDVDKIKQIHPNIQKYINMVLEDYEKGEFVFNFIFKK